MVPYLDTAAVLGLLEGLPATHFPLHWVEADGWRGPGEQAACGAAASGEGPGSNLEGSSHTKVMTRLGCGHPLFEGICCSVAYCQREILRVKICRLRLYRLPCEGGSQRGAAGRAGRALHLRQSAVRGRRSWPHIAPDPGTALGGTAPRAKSAPVACMPPIRMPPCAAG